MRILYLTLKKKWFVLIASGQKKYEYRTAKAHWISRMMSGGKWKTFDVVRFRNGYSKTSPVMDVEIIGFSFMGERWVPEHGEDVDQNSIVIHLGRVIQPVKLSTS